jgi:hypothetical protein
VRTDPGRYRPGSPTGPDWAAHADAVVAVYRDAIEGRGPR